MFACDSMNTEWRWEEVKRQRANTGKKKTNNRAKSNTKWKVNKTKKDKIPNTWNTNKELNYVPL